MLKNCAELQNFENRIFEDKIRIDEGADINEYKQDFSPC